LLFYANNAEGTREYELYLSALCVRNESNKSINEVAEWTSQPISLLME
jgi:hypothetical protein